MPYSDTRTRPWVLEELRARGIAQGILSVVDVGAGAGGWLNFLKPCLPAVRWTAVEVWSPYVVKFQLHDRYDEVIVQDVRGLEVYPQADFYIFGDVLEHMTANDARYCWGRARSRSRWLVASLPIYQRYEQGALEGNPHEEHLHHWDEQTFLDNFPGIVASSPPIEDSCAGAFLAEGLT